MMNIDVLIYELWIDEAVEKYAEITNFKLFDHVYQYLYHYVADFEKLHVNDLHHDYLKFSNIDPDILTDEKFFKVIIILSYHFRLGVTFSPDYQRVYFLHADFWYCNDYWKFRQYCISNKNTDFSHQHFLELKQFL